MVSLEGSRESDNRRVLIHSLEECPNAGVIEDSIFLGTSLPWLRNEADVRSPDRFSLLAGRSLPRIRSGKEAEIRQRECCTDFLNGRWRGRRYLIGETPPCYRQSAPYLFTLSLDEVKGSGLVC
ncbi:hypothetical protein EVAR_52806_1 [Eumeta japonica]|uniref:Uncharacterized protein n=1 Tax=Eumeta variegata TaxID=151549 RepID=A0A4C1Y7Q0_EUMVA|nr:hypothetical protein EVAR_52806_1 [Eumeta japonica]